MAVGKGSVFLRVLAATKLADKAEAGKGGAEDRQTGGLRNRRGRSDRTRVDESRQAGLATYDIYGKERATPCKQGLLKACHE
jgi:hypothetical protein